MLRSSATSSPPLQAAKHGKSHDFGLLIHRYALFPDCCNSRVQILGRHPKVHREQRSSSSAFHFPLLSFEELTALVRHAEELRRQRSGASHASHEEAASCQPALGVCREPLIEPLYWGLYLKQRWVTPTDGGLALEASLGLLSQLRP